MFVGMDVHKNYLQVSVLDENGKILNNSGVDNNLITEVKYSKAKILIVHMDYTDR
jgi:mRNA-degrading endonuclease HigB of HigAB toxin-antitoxin module